MNIMNDKSIIDCVYYHIEDDSILIISATYNLALGTYLRNKKNKNWIFLGVL